MQNILLFTECDRCLLHRQPKQDRKIDYKIDTDPGDYELSSKWIPRQNTFLQQWHERNQVEAGTLCHNVL